MKLTVVVLTTIVTTTSLSVPVIAQITRPSQDFFEQGRERLEREIQTLQEESLNSQRNPQKPPAEPILEVSPSPTPSERNQKPPQVAPPNPKPKPN